jgi:hypothetical protein
MRYDPTPRIYHYIRRAQEVDDSPMKWVTYFFECKLCEHRVKIGSPRSKGFAVANMMKHFRKAHPDVEVD